MSLLPAADRHVALIDGYIASGQERYRTMWAVHVHPWTFNSEITQPIRNNARQLKNMIANLEKNQQQNQNLVQTDYVQKVDYEAIVKIKDFFKERCTELERELASSKNQLNQALKDSEMYRNSWHVAVQKNKKQDSQQSTYKSEIERLSKQCNINFNAYKKQLQLKEKISKDYNVNVSNYQNHLKKQADLTAQKEKETAKVNELNWIISGLNNKIEDLEVDRDINYNAYIMQDSLKQKALEENDILSSKNHELWTKLSNIEQQIKKITDENAVQKLQVQIMTNGYAQLYLKLNTAQAQLTTAGIPISYKTQAAIEIKQGEEIVEQPQEQSNEVSTLKAGLKLITQDYAQLYLKTMLAQKQNIKLQAQIQQIQAKEAQIAILNQEKQDLTQKISNLINQINQKQKEHKNQMEKNSLQLRKSLGKKVTMTRWLYDPKKSWQTVLNEFVAESSLSISPKAIVSISIILCHSDGSAAVKVYYDQQCEEKPSKDSIISYRLVRTKVNVGDQLLYKSFTQHEQKLWSIISELKENGARIISGSDLEVNLGHEDNLSVIWYENSL